MFSLDTSPDPFNIHCLLTFLSLMGSISHPLSIHLLMNYLVSLGWCMFQVVKIYNEGDVNFLIEIKISFYIFQNKELNILVLLLPGVSWTLFPCVLLSASRSGTTHSRWLGNSGNKTPSIVHVLVLQMTEILAEADFAQCPILFSH